MADPSPLPKEPAVVAGLRRMVFGLTILFAAMVLGGLLYIGIALKNSSDQHRRTVAREEIERAKEHDLLLSQIEKLLERPSVFRIEMRDGQPVIVRIPEGEGSSSRQPSPGPSRTTSPSPSASPSPSSSPSPLVCQTIPVICMLHTLILGL